ncbi:PLD nuclease N-terminal domain-containing protein [Hymenobacter sp. B81]|uniref:PLD nuclease N-terminal domain-containing protein n=1 Tax=Hymenobacter sp. B81 TaxID=3344878 RepID=UPI0037DCC2A2
MNRASLSNTFRPLLLLAPMFALALSSCSRRTSGGSMTLWGGIVFILDVLAVIDVLRQPWSLGKKLIWIAVIFFLPVLGLILYYLFGRGKS